MDKTWWDHLVDYVSSPNTGSGQMAVSTAPFFQEVPDKALQGILPPEGVDAEPFWDAIKRALPRRRKALHQSNYWVVHLLAGAKSHKPLMKLESDDTVVLELDIQRSAAQNVYNDAVWSLLWSLLLRAAREGRLAAVIGGPPCRTMSVLRHRPGGPARFAPLPSPLASVHSPLVSAS